MPFGQGDSPLRECFRLIEHDRGGHRVAEEPLALSTIDEMSSRDVEKAYEFCKQALA
jgi:hypothetical protein